tara:strand:+ start:52 stop:384 length:333 start_codon:yes stop_codon:yes gene_type:complete
MKGFKNLGKIKELYSRGGNIIQYLKNLKDSKSNKTEDILISYDLQSGSYIKEVSKSNLDAKIATMECYEFEKRMFPHARSPKALSILAKYRGLTIGKKYAEAFNIARIIS